MIRIYPRVKNLHITFFSYSFHPLHNDLSEFHFNVRIIPAFRFISFHINISWSSTVLYLARIHTKREQTMTNFLHSLSYLCYILRSLLFPICILIRWRMHLFDWNADPNVRKSTMLYNTIQNSNISVSNFPVNRSFHILIFGHLKFVISIWNYWLRTWNAPASLLTRSHATHYPFNIGDRSTTSPPTEWLRLCVHMKTYADTKHAQTSRLVASQILQYTPRR